MNLPVRRLLVPTAVLLIAIALTSCEGAPTSRPPAKQKHGIQTLRLIAEGTPRRAHVYVKVGGDKIVDEARNLPWQAYVQVSPTEFLEFTVTVIDVRPNTQDVVKCSVVDLEYHEKAHDGPKVHVDCGLPALQLPA